MPINKKLARWIGIIAVFAGLCVFLLWGFQVIRALYQLKSNIDSIQELIAEDNPLTIDAEVISNLVTSLRVNIKSLKTHTAFLIGMSPKLRWVPKFGPLIAELPHILDLADTGTHTLEQIWILAEPAYIQIQADGFQMGIITELLAEVASASPLLSVDAERMVDAYSKINPEAIPGRYRALFLQMGPLLTLYMNGLPTLGEVPELMGVDNRQTYLILALNEDELRPGGGFITGVGTLNVMDGKIASMDFEDSYSADDYSLPYPDPPAPLSQFMALDLWVFRDSNWSPDFPTSAQQALALYRPAETVEPKGVFTVDQYAAESIIDIVGPLTIPGYENAVTGSTLVDYIRTAWAPDAEGINAEWYAKRKSFMSDLTQATVKRIESGAVDWTRLAAGVVKLIEQRHVQLFIQNEKIAEFLYKQRWDSRLLLPAHDHFTFVEANVGYNKASKRIDRRLVYDVDLTQTPPIANVILTLKHQVQNQLPCIAEAEMYPTYEQSMEKCYWAYLRFYVPEDALLLDASQHPIPAEHVLTGQSWKGVMGITQAEEGKATVFEQAVLVPTASQKEVHFSYNLPADTVIEQASGLSVYKLTLQKQAGLVGMPAHVILHLPQNALISKLHPEAELIEPGVFVFDIVLEQDTDIEVHYMLSDGGK